MVSRKTPRVEAAGRMRGPCIQLIRLQVVFRDSCECNDWTIERRLFAETVAFGQCEIRADLGNERFSQLGAIQYVTNVVAVILAKLCDEFFLGERRDRRVFLLDLRSPPACRDEQQRFPQASPAQLPDRFESASAPKLCPKITQGLSRRGVMAS